MENEADNEQLLADVLSEAVPAEFRGAMLGETLRRVRRRRRWRQTRRAAAALAALGLTAALLWQNWPEKSAVSQPLANRPVKEGYQLVLTQPLPASAIVTTQPLTSGQFIASAAAIGVVQTTAGNFRVINDAELLALVASHPAVLIRTGPRSEALVFANPEDQNGFPLN